MCSLDPNYLSNRNRCSAMYKHLLHTFCPNRPLASDQPIHKTQKQLQIFELFSNSNLKKKTLQIQPRSQLIITTHATDTWVSHWSFFSHIFPFPPLFLFFLFPSSFFLFPSTFSFSFSILPFPPPCQHLFLTCSSGLSFAHT